MNAARFRKLRNNPRKCIVNNINDFNKRKQSCLVIKSVKNSFLNSIIVAIANKFKNSKDLFKLSLRDLKTQNIQVFKRIREELRCKAFRKIGIRPNCVKDWIKYFKSILIDIIIFQGNLHFKIFGDVNELKHKQQIHIVRFRNNCKIDTNEKFKYDVLKKLAGYLQKGYICDKCFKCSKSKLVHCCRYACYMCKSTKRHDRDEKLFANIKCNACNRYFYGKSCRELHIRNGECNRKKYCGNCFSVYVLNRDKPHFCKTENYCTTCKIVHKANQHFIKGDISKPEPIRNFLIFDYETFPASEDRKETPYFCSTRLYTIEYKCVQDENNAQEGGGDKSRLEVVDYTFTEKNFEGLNCSKEFYNYIVSGDIPKDTVCLAHNGQSFDFYFVLKHFYSCENYEPDLIINGAKVMQMKFAQLGLKFVDSYNFIPFPLRNFPKLFGFSDKKTFFPHNFVSEKTLDYNGKLPNISEYGKIKEHDWEDFKKFYNDECDRLKKNNATWCLMTVARKYCVQDVNVLFLGVFNYLKTFMKVTKGIDPFA
jgi:DNA polymerase type B, organellar and viral